MLDNNQNFDAVSRTLASYEQQVEAQFELRAQRDRMLDGTSARWQLMYSGGCLGVFQGTLGSLKSVPWSFNTLRESYGHSRSSHERFRVLRGVPGSFKRLLVFKGVSMAFQRCSRGFRGFQDCSVEVYMRSRWFESILEVFRECTRGFWIF